VAREELQDSDEVVIRGDWCVYLLACADGSYYCGITRRLEARLKAHREGKGARYTRGRGPIEVLAHRPGLTRSQAARLEWQVKRQPRAMKLETLLQRPP
jgi:putative endonuclease